MNLKKIKFNFFLVCKLVKSFNTFNTLLQTKYSKFSN